MKAQIIKQLKQTTDKVQIDELLDRLSVIMNLEKFAIMDDLLVHLGSKPLVNLGGNRTGEIISPLSSTLNTATN